MNEIPTQPPAARKRKLRGYIISFVLVFLTIFGIANSSPSGIMFATGANSWIDYGRPSPWIRIHTYSTHAFIGDHWEHEFHFEGAEIVSWSACLSSVAACSSLSAALVATPTLGRRLVSFFHLPAQ